MVPDGHIAEDGRAGIDGDITLDIRMALIAFDQFPAAVLGKAQCPQGNP